MQVALSLDFDAQEVHYDDRRLRTHIHDICGSLVLLSGDRVQLVHSTAKLYVNSIIESFCSNSIAILLSVRGIFTNHQLNVSLLLYVFNISHSIVSATRST